MATTDLANASFKFTDNDIIRKTSKVRQLVDILRVDISSTSDTTGVRDSSNDIKTRKKYEVFVTGGVGDGIFPVTSSLFHTVFDQNHETQTANELFDITIGCYHASDLVSGSLDTSRGIEVDGSLTGIDASGKKLFSNDVLMMREKINIYKQYAQYLLGNSEAYFTAPFSSFNDENPNVNDVFVHENNEGVLSYRERIDEAIFINFKRLFVRDGIVKEQFVLRLLENANSASPNIGTIGESETNITDTGALTAQRITKFGGNIATLKKDSVETGEDENVGLIFYEKGIIVLDASRIFDTTQNISGSISAVSGTSGFNAGSLEFDQPLIPNFWTTGSIDDILDHLCETRFGRSNASAVGFVNQTFINSSIYVCRVAPSQANYSRNPTYTNKDTGDIRVIEEKGDDPFSYITTIGLYSGKDLVAVAKTSRPIEKNPEIDLSISVRIDY